MLDVAFGEFGGLQGGVGGGETCQRICVVHLEKELVGPYLLADIDVDLLDLSSDLGVGLEVVDRLDVAVGGGGLDEISVGYLGDVDGDVLAGEGADGKHRKDEDNKG